jgi:hypothetical protein
MSEFTCEKCGQEPGTAYTFLFGRIDVEVLQNLPTLTETRTTKRVEHRETVMLGQHCVEAWRGRERRMVLSWVLISLAVLVIAPVPAVVGFEGMDASMDAVETIGILVALVALLALIVNSLGYYFEIRKSAQTVGESLAIRLRRAELKKNGVTGFWTQEDWANEIRAQ